MNITHNEAVESYKNLIKYCRNRSCDNCVFDSDKCFFVDFHFNNDVIDVNTRAAILTEIDRKKTD